MWGEGEPFTHIMGLQKTHYLLVFYFWPYSHHRLNLYLSIPRPSPIKLGHGKPTTAPQTHNHPHSSSSKAVYHKKSITPPSLSDTVDLIQLHCSYEHIMAASMGKLAQ